MKVDARIVSDAFEAVTNGMYDDDVLKELSKVSESSFFADWKYLTESLYSFYNEDFIKAGEHFRKIAEDSIPYLTAPVFYKIISKEKISTISGLSNTENHFINNIIKDNIAVKSSLNQIETNLKSGQEDRFTDNITLLLSDICAKDRQLSKKLAAWGLKQLSLNDMSPSLLLENLKLIFGESESFRLTAVAFKDEDPELSLLFFIKSALIQIRNKSADKMQIESYIDIFRDLLIEIKHDKIDAEEDSDDEMTEQLNNILTVIEREINILYPELLSGSIKQEVLNQHNSEPQHQKTGTDTASEIKNKAEKIISVQPADKNTDNKKPAPSSKTDKDAENPVQLELFF